jgi:hypothetical protein
VRSVGRSLSWHALLVLACVACGAFYTLPYVSHIQALPADDSWFYVRAIRDVGRLGLVDAHIAARPAYPLIGALLSSVSGTSSLVVAAALPVTLAVSLGLAGAAFAARTWSGGPGIVLFGALVATSGLTARLVAGKSENLMSLVLLCAVLAIALWMGGRGRWLVAGAFCVAAGLTEWPLLLGFIGIVAATVLLSELITPWRWTVRPVLLPLLGSAAAGLALALGIVLIGSHANLAIRHLPIAEGFHLRFIHETKLLWMPLTVGLVGLGLLAALRNRTSGDAALRPLLGVWLALTAVAFVVGDLGARLPTYRAVTFALPIALATSAAAFFALTWLRSDRRVLVRIAAVVMAGLIAVVAVAPAASIWYKRAWVPVSTAQLEQIRGAARYALSLPEGQRVVVVMHLDPVHITTLENITAGLQPEDHNRLLIFIGKPVDVLAGRPTIAYAIRNRPLLLALWPPIARALRDGAAIVTGHDLHRPGFRAMVAKGATTFAGGKLAVLRGPPPPSRLPGFPLPHPLVPAPALGGFAGFSLAALFLAGIGWSVLLLVRAPSLVRTAMAPGFGLVAMTGTSLFCARVGLLPQGSTATVELVVVLAASAAAAIVHVVRARRTPRPSGEGSADPGPAGEGTADGPGMPSDVDAGALRSAAARPPSGARGGPTP